MCRIITFFVMRYTMFILIPCINSLKLAISIIQMILDVFWGNKVDVDRWKTIE